MVLTYFAADPKLLWCLILGLGAKALAPQIPPRLGLGLELATPVLCHGVILGPSWDVHDLHTLPQGGYRVFSAKIPCPKIAVTLQTTMLGGLCCPRDARRPGMCQHRHHRQLALLLGSSNHPRE